MGGIRTRAKLTASVRCISGSPGLRPAVGTALLYVAMVFIRMTKKHHARPSTSTGASVNQDEEENCRKTAPNVHDVLLAA